MKSYKGQATRAGLLVMHQFGHIALLVLLLVLVLFAFLGFRLSKGPIEVPRLASWFASQFTGEGVEVHVDKAELAWAGYHKGGEVPFVLKLAEITVRTESGNVLATMPAASLSLPVVDLFGGRKPIILDGESATLPNADVPVSWYANLWPGQGFTFSHGDVHVFVGAGTIGRGRDAFALNHARFTLSVLQGGAVQITNGQAQLAHQGHSAPNLTFSFAGRYNQNWQGLLTVQADKVQAQDLPPIWPAGLLPKTRQWMTAHITSGTAQNGRFSFNLAAGGDLSDLHINSLHGKFNISNVSLIWLKGAPLLTHVNGVFTIQDANNALITASNADLKNLSVQSGSLQLKGMRSKEPSGLLKMDLDGSVQDMLAILAPPPLNLLAHAPDEVRQITGTANVNLTADIPFKSHLKTNQIAIQIQAALTNLKIPTPVSNFPLTDGRISLNADAHHLTATGYANFAGAPARLTVTQDFSRAGGAGQFRLEGKSSPALWRALGVNTPYITMQGAIPFDLTESHGAAQSQDHQIHLTLDLTPASLNIPALGWSKATGITGALRTDFTMDGSKLAGVGQFNAQAPGLAIFFHSAGDTYTLEQIKIGRSQMSGTLTRPSMLGMKWILRGNGSILDLRLNALLKLPPQPNNKQTSVAPKPLWQTKLIFAKVYTAKPPALPLLNANLTASGVGKTITSADFSAQGINAMVATQTKGQHSLSLTGDDAGMLLNILGIYKGVRGGTLDLKAVYGNGPTRGILKLYNAQLVHAPGFVKILQAATLYGVAEALSGPGLVLSHTTIPFTLDKDTLSIHGADTYSEALGFTASGTVNINNDTCDLDTTIIPAYALNSFLGRIPLIGHLFTAEKGGGLFAMRAHIQGKINDPQVSVNPLSVFIPGFLRGIFGLGEPKAPH